MCQSANKRINRILRSSEVCWIINNHRKELFKHVAETLKTLPSVLSQISAGGIARAGSSTAASVLIMLPMILVYLITQSNIMETMSSAGIKE